MVAAHSTRASARKALTGLPFALLNLLIASLCQYMRASARRRTRRHAKAPLDVEPTAQAIADVRRSISNELRTPVQTLFATVELLELQAQNDVTARLIRRLNACLDQIQLSLNGMAPSSSPSAERLVELGAAQRGADGQRGADAGAGAGSTST
jgi:hypothetical protein